MIHSQVFNLFIIFIIKIFKYIRVQYILIIVRERVLSLYIAIRYYTRDINTSEH